jgi:hypothetical protein
MTIPARAHNFGTYFISSATAARRSIFQAKRNAKLFGGMSGVKLSGFFASLRMTAFMS